MANVTGQEPVTQDDIFVLRTTKPGSVATKRFVWNTETSSWDKSVYSMGTRFVAQRHTVTDITSLAALIEQTRRDPLAFIVRGEVAPGRTPGASVNRRYLVTPGKPDPDWLDKPRSWLMGAEGPSA